MKPSEKGSNENEGFQNGDLLRRATLKLIKEKWVNWQNKPGRACEDPSQRKYDARTMDAKLRIKEVHKGQVYSNEKKNSSHHRRGLEEENLMFPGRYPEQNSSEDHNFSGKYFENSEAKRVHINKQPVQQINKENFKTEKKFVPKLSDNKNQDSLPMSDFSNKKYRDPSTSQSSPLQCPNRLFDNQTYEPTDTKSIKSKQHSIKSGDTSVIYMNACTSGNNRHNSQTVTIDKTLKNNNTVLTNATLSSFKHEVKPQKSLKKYKLSLEIRENILELMIKSLSLSQRLNGISKIQGEMYSDDAGEESKVISNQKEKKHRSMDNANFCKTCLKYPKNLEKTSEKLMEMHQSTAHTNPKHIEELLQKYLPNKEGMNELFHQCAKENKGNNSIAQGITKSYIPDPLCGKSSSERPNFLENIKEDKSVRQSEDLKRQANPKQITNGKQVRNSNAEPSIEVKRDTECKSNKNDTNEENSSLNLPLNVKITEKRNCQKDLQQIDASRKIVSKVTDQTAPSGKHFSSGNSQELSRSTNIVNFAVTESNKDCFKFESRKTKSFTTAKELMRGDNSFFNNDLNYSRIFTRGKQNKFLSLFDPLLPNHPEFLLNRENSPSFLGKQEQNISLEHCFVSSNSQLLSAYSRQQILKNSHLDIIRANKIIDRGLKIALYKKMLFTKIKNLPKIEGLNTKCYIKKINIDAKLKKAILIPVVWYINESPRIRFNGPSVLCVTQENKLPQKYKNISNPVSSSLKPKYTILNKGNKEFEIKLSPQEQIREPKLHNYVSEVQIALNVGKEKFPNAQSQQKISASKSDITTISSIVKAKNLDEIPNKTIDCILNVINRTHEDKKISSNQLYKKSRSSIHSKEDYFDLSEHYEVICEEKEISNPLINPRTKQYTHSKTTFSSKRFGKMLTLPTFQSMSNFKKEGICQTNTPENHRNIICLSEKSLLIYTFQRNLFKLAAVQKELTQFIEYQKKIVQY